jgi:hypothetical protein
MEFHAAYAHHERNQEEDYRPVANIECSRARSPTSIISRETIFNKQEYSTITKILYL